MRNFSINGARTFILTMAVIAGVHGLVAGQGASRTSTRDSQAPAPLVAVHATGSQRYTEDDIATASGLKKGAIVRPPDFKAAADELVASGAFEEVRYRYEPAGTGYAVTFEVADAQEFLPVFYDNFVWFTDQQLTDAVHQKFPLFKGEVSTTDGMLEKVTDMLQGILADRGITGAVRFVQEGSFGRGKAEGKISGGVFTIDGLNVTVRRVEFPGAAARDLAELQKTAETLLKIPYQRSIASAFAEGNLHPVYARRGYLKAKFGAPELKLLKDDVNAPEVALTIAVQPGSQYHIDKMRWWGVRALHAEDLQRFMTVKPGEAADAPQIESDLDKVRTAYARKGYLKASIAAHTAFDDSDNTVSYEFAVQEGDVYRLHEVEVAGAGLTKDTVARLREAWQLREGEPYDAGYERDYIKAVRAILAPNVTLEVNRDVSDENKTVDVNISFVAHADKVIREDTK